MAMPFSESMPVLGQHLFLLLSSFWDAACSYMSRASKYFQQAFPKYDDLNASVQENVSAIRVVKAYVREGHETSKFQKASGNIYNIFCKAEKKYFL